ncbi:hypothetical protein GQX74_013625 [Glossina fuscipes]|nr:hypothetical protein GQX74_013625 [Glossina fuscipes]
MSSKNFLIAIFSMGSKYYRSPNLKEGCENFGIILTFESQLYDINISKSKFTVDGSLVTDAVKPAALEPLPEVNCDLAVPGSPSNKILMSPRLHKPSGKRLRDPPNSMHANWDFMTHQIINQSNEKFYEETLMPATRLLPPELSHKVANYGRGSFDLL